MEKTEYSMEERASKAKTMQAVELFMKTPENMQRFVEMYQNGNKNELFDAFKQWAQSKGFDTKNFEQQKDDIFKTIMACTKVQEALVARPDVPTGMFLRAAIEDESRKHGITDNLALFAITNVLYNVERITTAKQELAERKAAELPEEYVNWSATVAERMRVADPSPSSLYKVACISSDGKTKTIKVTISDRMLKKAQQELAKIENPAEHPLAVRKAFREITDHIQKAAQKNKVGLTVSDAMDMLHQMSPKAFEFETEYAQREQKAGKFTPTGVKYNSKFADITLKNETGFKVEIQIPINYDKPNVAKMTKEIYEQVKAAHIRVSTSRLEDVAQRIAREINEEKKRKELAQQTTM